MLLFKKRKSKKPTFFLYHQLPGVPKRLLLARATLGFLSGAAAVEVAFVADLTSKTDRVDWVNMQTSHLVRKKWGTDRRKYDASHLAQWNICV
jgi:hypothetical protein